MNNKVKAETKIGQSNKRRSSPIQICDLKRLNFIVRCQYCPMKSPGDINRKDHFSKVPQHWLAVSGDLGKPINAAKNRNKNLRINNDKAGIGSRI